jgi:hypothetical protein
VTPEVTHYLYYCHFNAISNATSTVSTFPLSFICHTNKNHNTLVGQEAASGSRPSAQPRKDGRRPSQASKQTSVRAKGGRMGSKGGGVNQSKQQDAGKSRGSSATVKGKSSKVRGSRSKGQSSGRGQPKKQNASEASEIPVAASASRSKPPRNTRANVRESSHSPVAVSASQPKAPRSTQEQPEWGFSRRS